MNKISKILVMAIVVLAVVTMSLCVNANTQSLISYVTDIHNINDMVFELTDSQKEAVKNYVATLDDATADSALADIQAAEAIVRNSGARTVSQISASDKQQVINLATSAATKSGLTLTVNTANDTFKLTKSDGSTLVSSSANTLIKYNGSTSTSGSSSTASTTSSSSTLLYTGANYVVYGVAAIAIIAVAVVVKKRA
jgi:hypothetical protein